MNPKKYNKIIYLSLALGLLMFCLFNLTKAQTAPEFLITWKASNYAPPNYQGKILPIPGSTIAIAVELIDNGQIADLSQSEIRWSVNNTLKASGLGMKNLSLRIDSTDTRDQDVTITIIGYRGQNLQKSLLIPLALPEVIIQRNEFNTFRALPYFFNVSNLNDLSFNWLANGQAPSGLPQNPDILNLNLSEMPTGLRINIDLNVVSKINSLERANASLNFEL